MGRVGGFSSTAPRNDLSGKSWEMTTQATEYSLQEALGQQDSIPHLVLNSTWLPCLQPICGQTLRVLTTWVSKLSWPFLPLLLPSWSSNWAWTYPSERQEKEPSSCSSSRWLASPKTLNTPQESASLYLTWCCWAGCGSWAVWGWAVRAGHAYRWKP